MRFLNCINEMEKRNTITVLDMFFANYFRVVANACWKAYISANIIW